MNVTVDEDECGSHAARQDKNCTMPGMKEE
jgi:hypothetical protein